MIFPHIFTEKILQEKDKTRLSAVDTFRVDTAPAITDVLIRAEASEDFVSVYNDGDEKKWLMDWAYLTEGEKVVTVKVIDDVAGEYTEESTIQVITALEDHLFSTDQDLLLHEHDIKRYIAKGRNSWNDKHRAAQAYIVDHLNDEGITDQSGDRLEAAAIVDIDEVREWSKYKTLHFIYEDIKVTGEDVFNDKANKYMVAAENSAEKAFIRLDISGDGVEDISKNLITTRLLRR